MHIKLLLNLARAVSQVKLVEARAAAALDAVAAQEAEQRCAALKVALATAELEFESSVSGRSRLPRDRARHFSNSVLNPL